MTGSKPHHVIHLELLRTKARRRSESAVAESLEKLRVHLEHQGRPEPDERAQETPP